METDRLMLFYRFGVALVRGLFTGLQRGYPYQDQVDEEGNFSPGSERVPLSNAPSFAITVIEMRVPSLVGIVVLGLGRLARRRGPGHEPEHNDPDQRGDSHCNNGNCEGAERDTFGPRRKIPLLVNLVPVRVPALQTCEEPPDKGHSKPVEKHQTVGLHAGSPRCGSVDRREPGALFRDDRALMMDSTERWGRTR